MIHIASSPGTDQIRAMPTLTIFQLCSSRLAHITFISMAIILCYAGGLDSDFLFDDGPNLDALVHIQGAGIFTSDFWEFVLSGGAGPTGRPISLFTFALQADFWPDSSRAFKLVNLLLHCLNASLIYLICRLLTGVLNTSRTQGTVIALACALIWGLHPVHTSSVLYAIQRMALLSNCFMLTGIFLHLKLRLNYSHHRHQLILLTINLGLTGLLALFSKENAPSLVFYLLVIEHTLLVSQPVHSGLKYWRYLFLWLPVVLVILLPLFFLEKLQGGFAASFDFSMTERLLTESRILWQYLSVLLLPTTGAMGLFHDITVSTSLFAPLTTMFSIAAWLAFLCLALVYQGKNRLLLFGLLWFWSGHVVESTLLPLELFFHHRNYLAFMGLVFCAIVGFVNTLPAALGSYRVKLLIGAFYVLMLFLNTTRISMLWSEPLELSQRWYEADPDTQRNAEFHAIELAKINPAGEILAARIFSRAIENTDDSFRLMLNLMTLACVNGEVPGPDKDSILKQVTQIGPESRDIVSPMQQLVTLSINDQCPPYDPVFLETLLTLLVAQTEGRDKGMFQFDLARLASHDNNSQSMLELLDQAYRNTADSGLLFNSALQLINQERYDEALVIIDEAIQDTLENNNIRTGTRSSKLQVLYAMRDDAVALQAESGK